MPKATKQKQLVIRQQFNYKQNPIGLIKHSFITKRIISLFSFPCFTIGLNSIKVFAASEKVCCHPFFSGQTIEISVLNLFLRLKHRFWKQVDKGFKSLIYPVISLSLIKCNCNTFVFTLIERYMKWYMTLLDIS